MFSQLYRVKRKPTKSRNTGAVKSKKVKVDGINFASSLEAYCYSELKNVGISFEYEGESFVVLDSFRYNGNYYKSTAGKKEMVNNGGKMVRAITYTPDFVSHKSKFIIETKGFVPSNHSFPLRFKMFLKLLSDNNMGDYSVYLPKNRAQVDATIKKILNE